MCNLYRMTKAPSEVANWFGAEDSLGGSNLGSEIFPGSPGLVIAKGHLRRMNWGFPLQLKGKSGQLLKPKPVTNAREDKLLTGFWRDSFVQRRCLIPVSQWAEPQGPAGQMTRTWYNLPDRDVLTVAGLWRVFRWVSCAALAAAGLSLASLQAFAGAEKLLRFHVLDTRQYRDHEPCSAPAQRGGVSPQECAELQDAARSLLGQAQEGREPFAIGEVVGQRPRREHRSGHRRQFAAQAGRGGVQHHIESLTAQIAIAHATDRHRTGLVLAGQFGQGLRFGHSAVDDHHLGRALRQHGQQGTARGTACAADEHALAGQQHAQVALDVIDQTQADVVSDGQPRE